MKAIDDGSFKGGQDLVLSAKDEAVGLPMKTSRFKKFTQADYDTLYKKLVNDEVKIINNEGAKAVTDIKVSNVKLHLWKDVYKRQESIMIFVILLMVEMIY